MHAYIHTYIHTHIYIYNTHIYIHIILVYTYTDTYDHVARSQVSPRKQSGSKTDVWGAGGGGMESFRLTGSEKVFRFRVQVLGFRELCAERVQGWVRIVLL